VGVGVGVCFVVAVFEGVTYGVLDKDGVPVFVTVDVIVLLAV